LRRERGGKKEGPGEENEVAHDELGLLETFTASNTV
jgi:hypothetical protein